MNDKQEAKTEEKKPRTTSQKWARREKIKEHIAELQTEFDQLGKELAAELGN